MTEQVITPTTAFDPWAAAMDAKPREYEIYGQIKIDVWTGYFPGGGAKPIQFDPGQHPADKKTVMIDMQLIPIPEQPQRFEVEGHFTDFSLDWVKITLPSIKALGIDLRALNGRWVKLAQVPGKRENPKKPGEYYSTLKFLAAFDSEAACREAFTGQPLSTEGHAAAPAPVSAEKQTALQFAGVVIKNAAGQVTTQSAARALITAQLAAFPMIQQHFTIDSPEIVALVSANIGHLPA